MMRKGMLATGLEKGTPIALSNPREVVIASNAATCPPMAAQGLLLTWKVIIPFERKFISTILIEGEVE